MTFKLTSGVLFLAIFLSLSCTNNSATSNNNDNNNTVKEDSTTGYQPRRLPITVSAQGLCGEFNNDPEQAATKYENSTLTLSGTVHQTRVRSQDDDCDYITIMCSNDQASDTSSVLIKCCVQSDRSTNPFPKGTEITIRCRFISFNNNVILLEELL